MTGATTSTGTTADQRKRGAPLRLARRWWAGARALLLRWKIYETEAYLTECEKEGIIDSFMLSEFRRDLCAMRIQLIDLEARS